MFQDEYLDDAIISDNSYSERKTSDPEESEIMKEVLSFMNKDNEDSDETEEIATQFNLLQLPDIRAWGKKKKIYYASDYVDTDLAILSLKDEQNAVLEEEEAKTIQKRLAKELDDVDFRLNLKIVDNNKETQSTTNHIIKVDTTKFTGRQKLDLLEKESPEFMALIQDIKGFFFLNIYKIFFNFLLRDTRKTHQLIEVKTTWGPQLNRTKKENYLNNRELICVQAKYQVLLNYCLNILFYLTLKAKRSFVNQHPVIKRLAQYRQLLNQLDSFQAHMLDSLKKTLDCSDIRKKMLRPQKFVKSKAESKTALLKQNKNEKRKREKNPIEEIKGKLVDNMSDNEVIMQEGRRIITYQISKNKGLTPHRNKEQRNPRVKHRNKYRKAKIRRKGAVREARKEIHRYAGEVSGIKVGLKKSISLK
ncbi:something about silencing protein 10 [Belonocnema kinseyi]|uniref:something about silencing protein 10 n=1 Tax=Belonocnema kinseyi TaxID=2817044 RepID=UPI00143CF35E|nr:something about silencing protein 10 [Belonocnema kinseyi]